MLKYPSIPHISSSTCLFDKRVYVSEKIHGANVCYMLSDGEWTVCSKNQVLPSDCKWFFDGVAYDILEDVIKPLHKELHLPQDIKIYGELYGEGIHKDVNWYKAPNGWPTHLKRYYRIFDIMIDGKFLTPDEFSQYKSSIDIFVKKIPISVNKDYIELVNCINSLVSMDHTGEDVRDSLHNLNIRLYQHVSSHEGVVFDTITGKLKMVFPQFREHKDAKLELASSKHIRITPRTIIDLITPVRIGKRLADIGGVKDVDHLTQVVIDDIKEELINDGRYITYNLDIMLEKNVTIKRDSKALVTQYINGTTR